MFSGCPCVRACVRACVRVCVRACVRPSTFLFPRYLMNNRSDFDQTWVRGSIGHVDHLIRFGGQTVKGQGHSGSFQLK